MKKNPKVERKNENVKWEYDVVSVYKREFECYKSVTTLKKEVNRHCEKGWISEGAPVFVPENSDGTRGYLLQNMIRPIVDEKEPTTLSGKINTRPEYDNIAMTNEF